MIECRVTGDLDSCRSCESEVPFRVQCAGRRLQERKVDTSTEHSELEGIPKEPSSRALK